MEKEAAESETDTPKSEVEYMLSEINE